MHFNQQPNFFQSLESFMHYVDNADFKTLEVILLRLNLELKTFKPESIPDIIEIKIQYVKDVMKMKDPENALLSLTFSAGKL